MTIEQKCVIEPEDIVAIRFECGNCRASVSVPIEAGLQNQAKQAASTSCAFCHTPWGFSPSSSEHMSLIRFATAMEEIARTMKGRNLQLRLEVKGLLRP